MNLLTGLTSKKLITFPSSLKTDIEGFNFLADLLFQTKSRNKFILDLKDVKWFEANLCAILGAIIDVNSSHGAKFEFVNFQNSYLISTLRNNGFLELLTGVKSQTQKSNSGIPFKAFDMKNEEEVEKYIYDFVLLSNKVPKMTEGAKRKIFRSIFELYQNAVMHSGAEKIYVCGQYYVNKKRMALTMVEIGRTFKNNVIAYKKEFAHFNGVQCLEWAVLSGNTTKSSHETGGLGLDLIREFLRHNQGKLQIRSADGYWEEKKGITFASLCTNTFAGSVVNIEFNLRDANSYFTKEELDIKDIL